MYRPFKFKLYKKCEKKTIYSIIKCKGGFFENLNLLCTFISQIILIGNFESARFSERVGIGKIKCVAYL